MPTPEHADHQRRRRHSNIRRAVRRRWAEYVVVVAFVVALIVALLLRETLFLVGLAAILVVGLAINTRSVLRHAARAEEVNLAFLRQARVETS